MDPATLGVSECKVRDAPGLFSSCKFTAISSHFQNASGRRLGRAGTALSGLEQSSIVRSLKAGSILQWIRMSEMLPSKASAPSSPKREGSAVTQRGLGDQAGEFPAQDYRTRELGFTWVVHVLQKTSPTGQLPAESGSFWGEHKHQHPTIWFNYFARFSVAYLGMLQPLWTCSCQQCVHYPAIHSLYSFHWLALCKVEAIYF